MRAREQSGTRLAGKVAFVTGAGSGLGKDMMRAMLAEGASVATLEVNAQYCSDLEADPLGPQARTIVRQGDVCDEAAVAAMVAACVERWGRLDVLVNNAGVSGTAPTLLADLPVAEWQRVMEVNVTGSFICTRAVSPAMAASGGGSIINITSIAARSSYPGNGSYGVSKAALEALTRLSAMELAPQRIRVNSISPGWFRTPLNEHVYADPLTTERRKLTIPMGRIGKPQDVSSLAVFLASDDSDYITGESIEIDGGLIGSGLAAAFHLAKTRPVSA